MNKKDVKVYLKKHKKGIALGVICVLVGVKIGKGTLTKDERDLIKTLKTVNKSNDGQSLTSEINKMLINCKSIIPVIPTTKNETTESFCKFVMQDSLKDRNLAGVMLFAK